MRTRIEHLALARAAVEILCSTAPQTQRCARFRSGAHAIRERLDGFSHVA
jgi:hypothetical protein